MYHFFEDPKHYFDVSDSKFDAAGTNGLESASTAVVVSTNRSRTSQGARYLTLTTFYRQDQISDIGVSALGSRCGRLRPINLSCCVIITDISVSALGY
jgi:hypothetical protein